MMTETLMTQHVGAFAAASALIARYGSDAAMEAAFTADGCRAAGDVGQFCRWREIERMVQLLQLDQPVGELH